MAHARAHDSHAAAAAAAEWRVAEVDSRFRFESWFGAHTSEMESFFQSALACGRSSSLCVCVSALCMCGGGGGSSKASACKAAHTRRAPVSIPARSQVRPLASQLACLLAQRSLTAARRPLVRSYTVCVRAEIEKFRLNTARPAHNWVVVVVVVALVIVAAAAAAAASAGLRQHWSAMRAVR